MQSKKSGKFIERSFGVPKLDISTIENLYEVIMTDINEFMTNVDPEQQTPICSDPREARTDFGIFDGVGGSLQFYLRLLLLRNRLESGDGMTFPQLRNLLLENLSNMDIDQNFESCIETISRLIVKRKPSKHRISFFFGPSGIYMLACHFFALRNDKPRFELCMDKVMEYYTIIRKTYSKQDCEILYGIPGYLYTLLYLKINCSQLS
jgi:hypothetical protein